MKKQLLNYCQKWGLSHPTLIAKTSTSFVFKAVFENKIVVLKVLTETGRKDELRGAVALQCFNGKGAVKVVNYDQGAHLLEYVSGMSLESLVKEGKDELACEIACEVLLKLHQSTCQDIEKLTPLEKRFSSLFKRSSLKTEKEESLYSLGAKVARNLLDSPINEVVLHGDLHHGNILFQPQRGWVAIDPKGLYGESTFDMVNILFNPKSLPEIFLNKDRFIKISGLISERMEIDYKRLLQFAFCYGCLSATWFEEDGLDSSETLKLVKIIRSHLGKDLECN